MRRHKKDLLGSVAVRMMMMTTTTMMMMMMMIIIIIILPRYSIPRK